jgi:hypothetical protein
VSWLPKGFEFLSGFPERIRRKRLILTLQAVFDDSGTRGQGRFMAMAGVLGDADVIAALADDWDRHLRSAVHGRIRYFKLDEAVTLDGEFRHWDERKRDDKIREMARVVDRYDLFQIAVAIDLDAYESIIGPWSELSGNHSLRHPYLTLCEYVLSASMTVGVERGCTKPMEIVYDEHTKFRPMFASAYGDYREVSREDPERFAVMPIQPWFRDDLEFVVLQAADMLAGETRLLPVEDKPAPLVEGLCPKLKATGHFKLITADDLRALDLWVRREIMRRVRGEGV